MTEILFYHLTRQPLEAALPSLLQRSLDRGWRAFVRATTRERMAALDDHLWTFSDDSFLPHGTESEADSALQPIVLGTELGNPNAAQVLFLLEGADIPDAVNAYERVLILFDGNDEDAVVAARAQWKKAGGGSHDLTYWQQDQAGRWQKKA